MNKFIARRIAAVTGIWVVGVYSLIWLNDINNRFFGPFDQNDPVGSESPMSMPALVIAGFMAFATWKILAGSYTQHMNRMRACRAHTRRRHPSRVASPVLSRKG